MAVSSIVLLITALFTGFAAAATSPNLGEVASFAVLAGSTVTNTGPSLVAGDLGVSPGSSVTGFPPGISFPTTHHSNDAVAVQAQDSLTTAYDNLVAQPCTNDLTGQDLGGLTLVPGVYCFDSSAFLTGTLTLDAQGDAAAVFIFKTESTLITASSSRVEFIRGGICDGAFWKVGSSATLGTGSVFRGNILALTSITVNKGVAVNGRLLARNGAVTLDTAAVSAAGCAVAEEGGDGEGEGETPTLTPSVDTTTTFKIPTADATVLPGTESSPTDLVFPSEPGATPTSTTAPTSSTNPSTPGQSVTLTAVVTSSGPGTPEGAVTFLDGSTVLGSVPLSGGIATFTTSSLTPGNHPITAVYRGRPGLAGSISTQLIQKVRQPVTGAERIITTRHELLVTTGINVLPLGLAALTAMLIGTGFLLESRRRTKAGPQGSPARLPRTK